MDNIGEEAIEDATATMKKVSKELDKCKFVGFGKVSVKDTPLVNKEIDDLFKKKSLLMQKEESQETNVKVKNIENEIATKLVTTQREKLEKEISALKDMKNKKGKSAVVFNLKGKVLGSKKSQPEPAVIKDPATEKAVTDVEQNKKIS